MLKLLQYFFQSTETLRDFYTVDEEQYEQDPLKIRTSEVSQFQDEAQDIEGRSPEREMFEKNIRDHIRGYH